jgi:hypothetical protein
VAQQVDAAVVPAQLEVAVAGVEPSVDDLGYRHLALADVQAPGLCIGAVTGIAFHAEDCFIFRAGVFL